MAKIIIKLFTVTKLKSLNIGDLHFTKLVGLASESLIYHQVLSINSFSGSVATMILIYVHIGCINLAVLGYGV